ncbi:MAG: helix-hairpin-helix domain-containing protein [Lachnospiraceae bacterium]|nr:helix-hairpin-helix domain-containing protein [Lachnospiraceae bacterium]
MKRNFLFIYCIFIILIFTACGQSEKFVKKSEVADLESGTSYSEASENQEAYQEEKEVACYVCGAVKTPGVYYLSESSIKQDAVLMAGGFAEGASEEYINLAEHIKEGERIYIPYKEELEADLTLSCEKEDVTEVKGFYDTEGRLNINYADKEALKELPGIGDAKADAIIKYREENGAFKTVDDIKNVTGIKAGVYDNIKDYITVD